MGLFGSVKNITLWTLAGAFAGGSLGCGAGGIHILSEDAHETAHRRGMDAAEKRVGFINLFKACVLNDTESSGYIARAHHVYIQEYTEYNKSVVIDGGLLGIFLGGTAGLIIGTVREIGKFLQARKAGAVAN